MDHYEYSNYLEAKNKAARRRMQDKKRINNERPKIHPVTLPTTDVPLPTTQASILRYIPFDTQRTTFSDTIKK